MLFNSFSFLLLFLPIALGGYFFLHARGGERLACAWLGSLSVIFYGVWDWRFVPLLLASIAFNYGVGRLLSRHPHATPGDRRLLAGAIGVDLLLLGVFKYSGFFADSANRLLGLGLPVPELILPLGISFFTFTQIAYLVDAYRKEVRDFDFPRYLLFVTFFPHLIAGPVLHHAEVMPQFRAFRREDWPANFAVGFTLFAFGLFKKTVLADSLAEYASPVFAAAQAGEALSSGAAWCGALAYTLQLYFDFSAYSDMAIGLALLFGVRFPANFNSPYQATSIIDFWRRWHMSLSRFLRDYLYIPLGGGRCAPWLRQRNLLLTMVLGGLWHGAGWTFVAWGALHGLYLVINHAWRQLCEARRLRCPGPAWLGAALGGGLTFLAVVVAWVYFRADSLGSAHAVLRAMVGQGGMAAPIELGSAWRWIGAGLVIVFAAPNALQMLRPFRPALETYPGEIAAPRHPALYWTPTTPWLWLTAGAAFIGLLNLTRVSEFLYFQF